ncbi:MAG TPA: cytochrome P450 [Longimicrobium sp.]|nr:cytochrome P450 [Longimicrobium sp.]
MPSTLAPTIALPSAEAGLEPFDPAFPELRADPHPVYRRYREREPIHWGLSGLAGYPGAWYLFRHADVVSVLKDPRLGKARRQVNYEGEAQPAAAPPVPEVARPFMELARKFIVHRDPPDHTRIRNLLRVPFSPVAAERMRPRIAEIANALLDRVAEKGEMEAISDYAFPLPVWVISEILGVPEEGRPILSAASRAFQAVDLRTSEETWRRAGDAVATTREYLGALIAERRRRPREDVLTLLVRACDETGTISEDELMANVCFIFVAGAGFETTTGLIGSGIHALLQHPDQRARLMADPALIRPATDEFLRYESPVQMTNRNVIEDVELDGHTLRAGDSVLAVLAAANRDPQAFPDPDRLDITRRGKAHDAFGVGIHFCLGGPLARVEGEVAIDTLFRRLPALQASGKAEWNPAVSLRVLKSLPAAF